MEAFYTIFPEIRQQYFDGLIITGAPVETLDFEEVDYWPELVEIMEWSKTHVTSTFHISLGSSGRPLLSYGVRKRTVRRKDFRNLRHHTIHRKTPLIRGFDDVFNAPHSRHSQIVEDVEKNPELTILADSEEAGPFIIIAKEGRQIFVTGHQNMMY